jgi:ABC-type nickel/cobalt efflux system permease component RcnA
MARMSATAAYFAGIFIGCVLTAGFTALWKALSTAETERLKREAAQRRYRLEQRIKDRENTHHTHRHD